MKQDTRKGREEMTYQVYSFVFFHVPHVSILSFKRALRKHLQLSNYNCNQTKELKDDKICHGSLLHTVLQPIYSSPLYTFLVT